MDFKSDMQARIQEIEAALQTYIPKQEAFPPVIFEAMGYSLFAGGKRLRPIMVLAACEAVGGKNGNAFCLCFGNDSYIFFDS